MATSLPPAPVSPQLPAFLSRPPAPQAQPASHPNGSPDGGAELSTDSLLTLAAGWVLCEMGFSGEQAAAYVGMAMAVSGSVSNESPVAGEARQASPAPVMATAGARPAAASRPVDQRKPISVLGDISGD